MRPILYIILIFFLCASCKVFNSEDSNSSTITIPIPPHQVSVAEKQTDFVTFNIRNTCASGCWINIGENIERKEFSFDIRVVAELSNEPCLAICLDLERNVTIEIPEPGSYSFNFLNRDSVYHELELSFP